MFGAPPTTRRVLGSAVAALTLGVGVVSLFVGGFSNNTLVKLLQAIAVLGLGALVIGGAVVLGLVHMAGWKEPESEAEFEAIVQRSERLAAGAILEPGDEYAGWAGSDSDADDLVDYLREPVSEDDFRALVRAAVDDLPLEFHRALEHVAVVVSDGGRQRRAYGLYQGDTIARDYFHDRIIIFRDTLTRDFGHDPDLLKAQVTRTVRHELAHHLGWDENGVRGLGL
jgi:predicted Zn-dependent protease with MMP-like domain